MLFLFLCYEKKKESKKMEYKKENIDLNRTKGRYKNNWTQT